MSPCEVRDKMPGAKRVSGGFISRGLPDFIGDNTGHLALSLSHTHALYHQLSITQDGMASFTTAARAAGGNRHGD